MALTQIQRGLLNRIKNGEISFSPDSEHRTIEQFQEVARAFVQLSNSHHIEMDRPHKESTTGYNYIDLINNCRTVD